MQPKEEAVAEEEQPKPEEAAAAEAEHVAPAEETPAEEAKAEDLPEVNTHPEGGNYVLGRAPIFLRRNCSRAA